MANIRIYTTPYCPYCVRAKQLLRHKQAAFEDIDVSDDPGQRQALIALTGQRTVPQIFINDQSIGGCDDLYALERAGRLDALINQ
ncbi:MAG: glutaredoxin 3 [Moraxellaceae bacterium]|nr:glutaredoxin 3 [Moraxellaceae bacterium]MDZ4297384.1 glutaredoxin 3 [Moraxellaceae bacterium]MDZ4386612.1 glutaredoxin 3 [Moraxellaceae bacterium]